MSQVLQNSRRKPRPWTAQEQVTAEVAAACGVSFEEIGRIIDRRGAQVRYHLVADAKEVQRRCSKQWSIDNPERSREISRLKMQRWRKESPDAAKEAARRYRLAHKEQISALGMEWRKAHRERINASKRRSYAQNREYRERQKESSRRWRRENPEVARRSAMSWRKRNKDKIQAYKKSYYRENRQKILEQTRLWHLANPVKVKESARKWQINNPEKRRQVCAHYYRRNRSKALQASRRCAAVRRQRQACVLIPLALQDIQERYALFNNRCAYCQRQAPIEVDHVLALSRNGCDEISNIVPACRRCNASKNASPVETWFRRQPFFTETSWRKIQRCCPAAVVGQLPLALPA
jgi:hypothetical protein